MNDMIDMSRFTEAKSDQLNADDLIGAPRTVTVTRVTGAEGDQPIAIHYENDGGKPFKPCKTIRRVLLAIWGRYANDYVGRSMTLYRDDSVTFGGLNVGGIRISHMSHIDKETIVVVMKTKGKKAGIKILPLKSEPQQDDFRKWADTYIATVNRAPDADKLKQYADSRAKKLAELQAARPELHTECCDALAAKQESFEVADGPDHSQHAAPTQATEIRALIEAATDKASWDLADNAMLGAELSDDEYAELTHALDLKKRALTEGME